MEEVRLFRVPTGYSIRTRLELDGGWTMFIDRFYEGEPWHKDDRVVYEGMSLDECADVMLQELFTART